MKNLLYILSVAVALIVCGCSHLSPPLSGYYYEGELPLTVKSEPALVSRFANELSAETGLAIRDTSNGSVVTNVHLSPNNQGKARFDINASLNIPKNMFYVSVRGDIASPEALAATQKAVELFAKEFPGSKLSAITVYPGLLGP
jgi:uncharacterized membrane protein YdfJ with MMPL/SSD domain